MNEEDDKRLLRRPLVPRLVLGHSRFRAARGHRVVAAGAHVAARFGHHAGSPIGAGWSVLAALARQVDVIVLSH